jgi:sRNA-binding protein
VVRGAQEPYRYEREVEDFLRWSPHVKNTRDKGVTALSRDQLAELQRLLTSFADTTGMDLEGQPAADRAAEAERRAELAEGAAREAAQRAARAEKLAEKRAREAEERASQAAERPRPSARPVEHYDDLAAEEVIALLASLEHEDLQTLREYEREHANRTRVLSAIESVLARGGSRV